MSHHYESSNRHFPGSTPKRQYCTMHTHPAFLNACNPRILTSSFVISNRATISSVRPSYRVSSPPKKRCHPRMLGPFFPDLSQTNLMKSDIVRKEMTSLERDYKELAKLGMRYEVSQQTPDSHTKTMYSN